MRRLNVVVIFGLLMSPALWAESTVREHLRTQGQARLDEVSRSLELIEDKVKIQEGEIERRSHFIRQLQVRRFLGNEDRVRRAFLQRELRRNGVHHQKLLEEKEFLTIQKKKYQEWLGQIDNKEILSDFHLPFRGGKYSVAEKSGLYFHSWGGPTGTPMEPPMNGTVVFRGALSKLDGRALLVVENSQYIVAVLGDYEPLVEKGDVLQDGRWLGILRGTELQMVVWANSPGGGIPLRAQDIHWGRRSSH